MRDVRNAHRVLRSESRSALMDLLRAAGRPLSVVEAAGRVGLQPSTTRLHLDLLASAGLVDRTVERRATAGRPRIHYAASPARDGTTLDDYEGLASALAGQLSGSPDPVSAAREAGRRWSEALAVPADTVPATPEAAVEAVATLMDRLGFAPDRPAGANRLDLRHCPFEAVARQQRGVVCGVHEGVLEETFRRLGGHVEVARLDAFAVDDPLLCVVHLRTLADPVPDSRGATGREDNEIIEGPGRPRSGRGLRGAPDA